MVEVAVLCSLTHHHLFHAAGRSAAASPARKASPAPVLGRSAIARKKRAAEEAKLVAARAADARRRAVDEPASVRAVILEVAESIDAMEVRRILVFQRDERERESENRARVCELLFRS